MVVSTADRLRPVPVALTREADVLAALDRLGASATGHNPDQVSGLPTSGLLAMSIPASFGGGRYLEPHRRRGCQPTGHLGCQGGGETAPASCGPGTGADQRFGRTAQGNLWTRCPRRCLPLERSWRGCSASEAGPVGSRLRLGQWWVGLRNQCCGLANHQGVWIRI